MSKKEPADLSDKATLFQAYVDLVNSERETIWARHNALLVANSLIVGGLAFSPTAFWESNGPRSRCSGPACSSASPGF